MSGNTSKNLVWRATWKDGILVFLLLFKISLIVGLMLTGDSIPYYCAPLVWFIFGLYFYYDVIVINHAFSHSRFFVSDSANVIFRILNSTALCYPSSLIEESHLAHHRYCNDKKGEDGETKDPLSSYRHGKNGEVEGALTYCLLSFLRGNKPIELYNGVSKRVSKWIILGECASICMFIAACLYLNWQWFLMGVMPSIYIGWVLSDAQNYFEHRFAVESKNRKANSVSYYGKIYNFLTFDEGYHQEHHYKPAAHWTARRRIRKQLEEEKINYYVARYPPALGFLEKD
jgi:fatty acid desaturase